MSGPGRPAKVGLGQAFWKGFRRFKRWDLEGEVGTTPGSHDGETRPGAANPLEAYFDSNSEGPGIWKWRHYFEIYHRHLAKFVGREVRVLEIGVYSGGSLGMWKEYFGPGCTIYGVDIEEVCKAYEDDSVRIFVGDQADRDFWARFKGEVPHLDVVIDDGGHAFDQQEVTLEETLPSLRPGGVYICEDVHGEGNRFGAYVSGLAQNLHAVDRGPEKTVAERPSASHVWGRSPLQRSVHSVHVYPFVTVIEKAAAGNEFVAEKHGTEWQPYLDKPSPEPR